MTATKDNFLSVVFYATVNCQVVCDHQGIILDVVARWPKEAHAHTRVDSFVFASPPSAGWLQPPGESGGSSETGAILFALTSSHLWLTRETTMTKTTTKPSVWAGES